MRIIFCTNDGRNIINGVNTWLLRLLPALKENGMVVSVIYTSWVPENECTLVPLLKEKGIVCNKINALGYIEREIKWILEHVKTEQPDILVANNMFPAFYASKWLKKAGIPTVTVLNNDGEECTSIIERFVAINNGFRATAVVAVSAHLKEKLSPYNEDILIKKIPYGVPVVNRKSLYNLNETFKIAYVGRISQEQKKIGDVANSFCIAATLLPCIEAYIYGSGPDEDIVKEILKKHGNPKNVFIKGSISNDRIQNELLKMHVITLLSDYEGLPVALMEAMGCGVVPVCKKIASGLPELVEENETGLFVTDADNYTHQINYLKQNPDIYNTLSANAHALISENFSIEKNIQEWINLLNKIKPLAVNPVIIPSHIRLPYTRRALTYENREPYIAIKAYRKVKRIVKKYLSSAKS